MCVWVSVPIHWYNLPCSYGLDMGFPILSIRFVSLSHCAHIKRHWAECIRYHIIKSNRLKFHADANKLCGFPIPLVCHSLLPVLSFLHPELMYFQPIFARTFVAFDYIFIFFLSPSSLLWLPLIRVRHRFICFWCTFHRERCLATAHRPNHICWQIQLENQPIAHFLA